jgi:hypothetical protein
VDVPAGDVHRTATLVHDAARDVIGRYRTWIGSYLPGEKAVAAVRAQMFSGFAPLREDEDVVSVRRVRSID